MIMGLPIIVVAPPYTLEYLKTFGIKTFDKWWDESYDREENHYQRIKKIFNLIDYINSKSIEELKIMYNEMKEIIEELKNDMAQKNISLDFKILKSSIIKANKQYFYIVFSNLLRNAIKYNKIGGTIDISFEKNSLKISDSGMGIAKEKLKDIYNRYYRATNEQGGFGIGLNIVNHLCSMYKIKIMVESQIDEGTTFTLTF